MERPDSTFPPLIHTPKLEIEEGKAYFVDDKERLPYKLLRNLGHGHSGNVEEVKDINTGRVFARKTIRIPGGRSGRDRKKIFENEVKIIRSLAGHHHVIRVFATYVSKYEVGQILHPVADEGDLERFLETFSQSLPDCDSPNISDIDKAKVDILKRSFGCLASGLEFMHQRKIRHKDVKPRNVLIHQGSVIYTDFGYSLDYSREGHSTTTGRPDFLTRRYSAPEVVDFEPRNSRSDVFSLGCVFLDVLSTLVQDLVLGSDQCYFERMSSIHTQMSSSSTPRSLEFLIKIVISMTLANPVERPTAAEVASKFRGCPGFSCSRCQPPQATKLPLRPVRTMIEPGDSNGTGQEPLLVIGERSSREDSEKRPGGLFSRSKEILIDSSSNIRSTVSSSSYQGEKDDDREERRRILQDKEVETEKRKRHEARRAARLALREEEEQIAREDRRHEERRQQRKAERLEREQAILTSSSKSKEDAIPASPPSPRTATSRRTGTSEHRREPPPIKTKSLLGGFSLFGRSKTKPVVPTSKETKHVIGLRTDPTRVDPASPIDYLRKDKERPSSSHDSPNGSRDRTDRPHRSGRHRFQSPMEEAEYRRKKEERRAARAREREHEMSGG
jgi:serine/threonine protein kinase